MIELELLEIYEKNLKNDKLVEVPQKQRVQIQIGQIRELWSVPVERFLILEEVNQGLYLTVPMTSYLQLLPNNSPAYKIKNKGLVLGVVPTWDYLRQELIERYSQVIGRVSEEELQKIKDYINKTKNLPWHTKRFIKLNSKRWAKWTMYSLLAQAELAEQEDKQVVKLPPEIENALPKGKNHEDKYIKGQNFFAVLKKDVLRVYLPVEMVGERIEITIDGLTVFEGQVECPRIDIEGNFEGVVGEIKVRR